MSCDYGMFVTQITGVGDAGTGGGSFNMDSFSQENSYVLDQLHH